MKKRCLVLGLAGLLLMPSDLACSMQNSQVSKAEISNAETPEKSETLDRKIEREVYNFADELSRKQPEDFIKEDFNNQSYYHSKNLKIEGGLPVEGSGRYVVTDARGIISLGEWINSGKEKVSIENVKAAFASYGTKGNLAITLVKDKMVIQYTQKPGFWERKFYDLDDLKDKDIEDINPKEETRVGNEEASKYLELIARIRKTYPPNAISKTSQKV